MNSAGSSARPWRPPGKGADRAFVAVFAVILGTYALFIVLLIAADLAYAGRGDASVTGWPLPRRSSPRFAHLRSGAPWS
jgi:hypothetical protein